MSKLIIVWLLGFLCGALLAYFVYERNENETKEIIIKMAEEKRRLIRELKKLKNRKGDS